MPFNGRVIPSGAMAEYHPISARDISRLHQFGAKVLPGIILGYVWYAGGIWKGDIMIADTEELEQTEESENYAKRLSAKEVLTLMSGEKFTFPIADGTVKLSGGGQVLRTSTLIMDIPDRGEEQGTLQGESDGSTSTPFQDSSWYDGDAKNNFWSITGDFICRHHVEPQVKLYMPREESFPIPLKYSDVTRTTHIRHQKNCWKNNDEYLDVDEKENFQMHGMASQDFLLSERPLDGYTWSGERVTRKQTTSRPDNVWPDMWNHMSDAAKRKAKQRWAIEKPKLDNARQLRGIFFIEPDGEEFKHTMKNARRKLEIPMPATMPCKTSVNCRGENLPQHWETQDHICLFCRCRRIYEKKMRRCAAQVSRRSLCCKRNKFTEPLQFGT